MLRTVYVQVEILADGLFSRAHLMMVTAESARRPLFYLGTIFCDEASAGFFNSEGFVWKLASKDFRLMTDGQMTHDTFAR
jgi:hypothetical protein